MKDVKKFIKAKKRKKLIKKITILSIVLVIVLFIFFTKAPIFNLQTISFVGNATIAENVLMNQLSDSIGENIFLLNEKDMKDLLMNNKYIKDVKIKKSGINSLKIEIEEEAPVYYVDNGVNLQIINENLEVLEEVDNIEGRNLVQIKGVDLTATKDEERIDEYNRYKAILTAFYPYIAKNKESIRLRELDILSIVDIRGYIGDIEIMFGDESDIHNKMENVYRIILSDEIHMTKGYINVSFDGDPVIMIEEDNDNLEDGNNGVVEEGQEEQ